MCKSLYRVHEAGGINRQFQILYNHDINVFSFVCVCVRGGGGGGGGETTVLKNNPYKRT
jgi:hypothetical protein